MRLTSSAPAAAAAWPPVCAMEHLTPAELLRFLEEEADTLQLINAKIANQLHCLQVEEELFSRQLSKLEKKRAPILAIESDQTGQVVNEKEDIEDEPENEIQGEGLQQQSIALIESAEQALGSSPTLPRSLDLKTEIQSEDGLEQQSTALFGSTEQAVESSSTLSQSLDPKTEIQSEGLEQQSTTLFGSTEQAVESSPTPQQSPGSQNRSRGDGQEVSQIIELENADSKRMEFQGQPEEQEVARVRVKATSQPQRTSARRISRRPARFQD